jgi:hypothetical protein
VRHLFADLREASRQQAALRASIVVASLVFALLLVLAGDTSSLALVVLTLLGLLCVVNPHTQLPGALMLYMLLAWGVGVPTVWHPLTLPAALCLLVIHVAAAIAAGVPAQASLPRALSRLYLARLLAVAIATTLVWALAGLVAAGEVPGGIVAALTGLGVVAVGLVTHFVTVTHPGRRRDRTSGRTERLVDRRPDRPTGIGMP